MHVRNFHPIKDFLRAGLPLVALVFFCGSPGASQERDAPAAIDVGQPLPAFQFVDMQGKPVRSDQLQGKVLLLDVWASWCGPCKTEMPEFEAFYRKYRERGLMVIGVSIDITKEDAQQFANEIGVSYPIVHHPGIMEEWGLLGLPTTFIMDRSGVVRRRMIGFEYGEVFEKALLELL